MPYRSLILLKLLWSGAISSKSCHVDQRSFRISNEEKETARPRADPTGPLRLRLWGIRQDRAGVLRGAPERLPLWKAVPLPNILLERLHHEGYYGLSWDEQRRLDWAGVIAIDRAGEALEAVRETMVRGWGWVYLWGQYGTAKSGLLKTAIPIIWLVEKVLIRFQNLGNRYQFSVKLSK